MRLRAEVLDWYPHDIWAFTQGLLLHDGHLYESTGGYGHSTLRQMDLATGQVLRAVRLPKHEFGEGLALRGNRLVQLTWKEEIAHVYTVPALRRIGQFRYKGEGWGLCFDGQRFISSDGGHELVFRHATTFA